MPDNHNANRARKFIWFFVILLLLVGGFFLIGPYLQKIRPYIMQMPQLSNAAESESQQQPQIAKSVLTSPLGQIGWHPGDPTVLAKQIEGFIGKADVKTSDDIIALISPHAGYAYSGQTAAFGIKAIKGKYTRVIVIGPSHYVSMLDVLSVPQETYYRTPLGEIPIDTEFVNKLLQNPLFKQVPAVNAQEHSIWAQLPLLQYRLGDFKLVPIIAGQCSQQAIQNTASILKSLVDSNTLVVASSDFVHYGPNYGYIPFDQNIPDGLRKLDMGAYDYISKLDSTGFSQYCDKTGVTICGRVPIAILLSMLPTTAKPELLKYTTSGELTNDFTNSVSYLSVVFHGDWQKPVAATLAKTDNSLTDEDKHNLLLLARKTIEFYLQNRTVPTPEQLGMPVTDAMKVTRAAFVTLTKNSELRGCIGEIFPSQPLYKSVIANAVNAAVNDWRFSPVTKDELNSIKIEISALTLPQSIDSYNQIRLGIDGVVLKKGGYSAVFLPQVAPEQRWTLAETLTHLSLKAGLPENAWKKGASFLVFQAEVFGESK